MSARRATGIRCADRPVARPSRALSAEPQRRAVPRDLAQETWIRVFRGIARLREPSKLRAWLFGIAHRVAMDRLRSKYAAQAMVDTELATIEIDDDGVNLDKDSRLSSRSWQGCPSSSAKLSRSSIYRSCRSRRSPKFSAPVGTVKSRLFRARRILRRKLDSREALS